MMIRSISATLFALGLATTGALAFSSTPIDGSQGGVPSFVSSGLGLNSASAGSGTGVGGGSPFIGAGGLPSFTEAPRPVDPRAFAGGWQLQQGRMLFGAESSTNWSSAGFTSSFGAGLNSAFGRGFGLSPVAGGWDVNRVKSGYLVNENVLLYSSVGQARPRDIWNNSAPPVNSSFLFNSETRGLAEARAGVQWQALPGLTLGFEVGGVQGMR